jgi:GrpB-like predicted nucleotidyltransferase (UPF0157 family)
MKVIIQPHNAAWAAEFLKARDNLYLILKDVPILSIEHVGSTAVPGLSAKPVLDIDIVVTPEHLPATRAAMVTARYIDLGELGIPSRFVFRQPGYKPSDVATGEPEETTAMRRNTYVVLDGSIAFKNHRDLKRVLLENVALREEYEEVKKRLAERELADVDEYCSGKNEILLKILESAGWSEEDLDEVRRTNE